MHFHWCGNPFHDIPMNLLVLLTVFPEWVPWAHHAKQWAKGRLHGHTREEERHAEGH